MIPNPNPTGFPQGGTMFPQQGFPQGFSQGGAMFPPQQQPQQFSQGGVMFPPQQGFPQGGAMFLPQQGFQQGFPQGGAMFPSPAVSTTSSAPTTSAIPSGPPSSGQSFTSTGASKGRLSGRSSGKKSATTPQPLPQLPQLSSLQQPQQTTPQPARPSFFPEPIGIQPVANTPLNPIGAVPFCNPIPTEILITGNLTNRFGSDFYSPRQASTQAHEIRTAEMELETGTIETAFYSLLSKEEIERLSGDIIIKNTNVSGEGSVNDPRMGMIKKSLPCNTCYKFYDCSGHYGRIDFAKSIVHPSFIRDVISILRLVCNSCGKLMITRQQIKRNHLDFLKGSKLFKTLEELPKRCTQSERDDLCRAGSLVAPCQENPEFDGTRSKEARRIYYKEEKGSKDLIEMPADSVYKIFDQMSADDLDILGFDYDPSTNTGSHPKNMILSNLLVIPPSFRKTSYKFGKVGPGDIVTLYEELIKTNNIIRMMNEKGNVQDIKKNMATSYGDLIELVSNIFDKDDGRYVKRMSNHKSIKSMYTSKEGEIREKLIGKRVTSSARSVIGPEPTLETGQVQLPEQIVDQVPVKELVTNFNIELFTRMIREGKILNIIQNEGKNRKLPISVNKKNRNTISIFIGDYVYRPLVNGDYIILNRQPTIHKFGIMGHEVIIGKSSSIKINPNAASPYNADFDGDEMNVHVPQTEAARREISINVDIATGLPILTSDLTEFVDVVAQGSGPEYNVEGYYNAGKRTMEEFNNIMNTLGTTAREIFDSKVALMQNNADYAEYKNFNVYSGKMLFSLVLPREFNYSRGATSEKDSEKVMTSKKKIIIKNGILVQGVVTPTDFFNLGSIGVNFQEKYGGKKYKVMYKELEQIMNAFFGKDKPVNLGPMNLYANILTGEKSTNIIGLIMDALSSTYIYTSDVDLETKEKLRISREVYYQALINLKITRQLRTLDARLEKHGIEKFSGKGYFSMALPEDLWYEGSGGVVIKDGILISGIITSDHVGKAQRSIIQTVALDYGTLRAGHLITDLNLLALNFLETRPLSITGSDIIIPDPRIKLGSEKILAETRMQIEALGTKNPDASQEKHRQKLINQIVDTVKSQGTVLIRDILSDSNNIKIMVKSGAKGSMANTAQMIEGSMRGQEFILGDRPKKTLPGDRVLHFHMINDPSPPPESQGFCRSSYAAGLDPVDAFIHAVAARIGGVNTAKSTAKTGYTSNRLHYSLQDLVVYTDGSVRNLKGQIVQYNYGDDNLNPQFLVYSKFEGNEFNIASPIDIGRTMRKVVHELTK